MSEFGPIENWDDWDENKWKSIFKEVRLRGNTDLKVAEKYGMPVQLLKEKRKKIEQPKPRKRTSYRVKTKELKRENEVLAAALRIIAKETTKTG